MRIAIEAGGFSPGEADQLRRAMATFKRTGTIGNYKQRMIEGMIATRLSSAIRRALLQADRGVRRIRLSRKPRRLLRAAGLCLLLVQDLLSRRLLRGDPELPADGVLRAGAACARRARPWRRDPRGRRQPFRLGLHAGGSGFRSRPHPRRAMPRCAASSGPGMPSGSAFARSRALSEDRMDAFVARRGDGYRFGARCLAALRPRRRRDREAGPGRRLPLARPRPPRRALGRCARSTARVPPRRLPLFDRPEIRLRDNEPETRLPVMPLGEHVIHDYRSLGLSLKAHPVAFLRAAARPLGVTPNERLPRVRGRQARLRGRAGSRAAAAGQGKCDLPDAGGREGGRQHHRLAEGFRALPAGHHGFEIRPRHRQAAIGIRMSSISWPNGSRT